ALAIGCGILTKGPVVLLYLIPAALFLPQAKRCILFAVPLGAAIALTWALPAAQAGGESYANAILWGQTAGRVHDSFSHARPFW
ncbi:MAG: glycosyltransferase family 39 protein, partial [Panacagrimonas sp.]